MAAINFQLVTPEKTVLQEELASLTCPTDMGYITILPGHEPLVANLASGELHAKALSGQDSYIFVSGGFVQINPNSQVVILADLAEHHYEIDAQKAEEAKTKAQKEMAEGKLSSEEYAVVSASLEKSLGRINIARKHSNRKNTFSSDGAIKE
jgi:F-type H+-transporting ATPase subunit epsilon